MNDKILINPKTNQEYRDVPPTVAAEYLGVALNYVYEGLKKQALPIGSAVQSDKGRWSYNIPVDRLKAYASGADISLLTALLNKLLGKRIGGYMEIIANNRANNREYIAFKDLKKGDIFVLASDGKWYIKNNDFYAVRLSDGETVEPNFTPLLCEVKDCVLVEREIYTALAEKERV